MAVFVHLAPESAVAAIRRGGIKASPAKRPGMPRSVYAMPVTPNFYISHQWLRELKIGTRTIVAVYFRIPDDEPVFLGHYQADHAAVTASEAVGAVMHSEDAEGFEVLIPRKIYPKEIHRIKHVPQVVGWRYYPGSQGMKPCTCESCLSDGRPGDGKLRRRADS